MRETLRFDDLPLQAATADAGRAPAAPGSPESALQPAGTPQDAPRYERQTETVRTVVDAYRGRLQEEPELTLGAIRLQPVSPSETRGYRVGSLANAPQLAHTGLQTGDVIVSVNGRPVGNVRQDRLEIDSVIAEGAARLEVQRGERRFFVKAPLR